LHFLAKTLKKNKKNNYYQKKLALTENPKTRWCCASLARLLVSLRLTIKFCFSKLAVWLFFLLRQFFSATMCILRTSFVWGKEGLVVVVCKGFYVGFIDAFSFIKYLLFC
jgi:hypothetical protein